MLALKGKDLQLRALEPSDLDFLYALENDETVWEVSNTSTPYSRAILLDYLENAHRDIYEVKQLRLVITILEDKRTIGFIDLFDFDPRHHRLGIGVILFSEADRGKGYAAEALQLVHEYAVKYLQVHQLYANITADNARSIQLFEKAGFIRSGVKHDWVYSEGTYTDEYFYQLFVESEK
ncbi:MAG: diamine N-acetyltransferase [Candidatus Latescibacterota bacterium]|jgi:diamine N-acetyltransferase